jgi:ceramide glucosyltransferase
MQVLGDLLLLASILGVVYLAAANASVIRFTLLCHPERSREAAQSRDGPAITVLKPISGLEPMLYENLASFCSQDYPNYEVILCLEDERDPARPTVERVIADFPKCSTRLFAGDNAAVRNPKIANLAKGAAAARGELIVISDSDVRVGPKYLHSVAASFVPERTGAISSLYRGITGVYWVSQLGAAYVEEQFAPSVLVATTFGRMHFCLGASMAVRRDVLDAIGGIAALGPYLADDHKLGELVAALGYEVVLSNDIVATTIAETTLRDLWSHELRWARTNLVLAPFGYAFSFLMFGVPLALLYLVVSRNWIVAVPVLAAAVAVRTLLHFTSRQTLGVREHGATLWLMPVRDAFSVAVWIVSFFGRSVRWRQASVTVSTDGQMQ